jgi:uncharacterized phosphosugar-binding protein
MNPTPVDLPASGAARYLRNAAAVLDGILAAELRSIRAAAELCASAITGGGLIHVLGTGHSHILAEELFYRAGGLAAVNPIFVDRLMLHVSAFESTRLERLAATGDAVLSELTLAEGDAMIVASNSGGNAVCDTVAAGARRARVHVIAVVSRAHAAAAAHETAAGDGDGTGGLLDVADVVIDNHGAVGDASIAVPGVPNLVGPTSTVAGAAIVNAIAVETAQLLATRGASVGVLASSNVVGGNEHNEAVLAPYRERVRSL